MSCWSVNSFDFLREKLHERFSASAVLQQNIERINVLLWIMHLPSIWATTSSKMLIENKFKAQTLTGNYRYQLIASRALNMSCSFSQSVRSIESRCVVNTHNRSCLGLFPFQLSKCSLQVGMGTWNVSMGAPLSMGMSTSSVKKKCEYESE